MIDESSEGVRDDWRGCVAGSVMGVRGEDGRLDIADVVVVVVVDDGSDIEVSIEDVETG
jgi:hypothetical protein